MRTKTTMGYVYDIVINGKKVTCLHKLICGLTEEKMNINLEREKQLTGLDLRIEEVETW